MLLEASPVRVSVVLFRRSVSSSDLSERSVAVRTADRKGPRLLRGYARWLIAMAKEECQHPDGGLDLIAIQENIDAGNCIAVLLRVNVTSEKAQTNCSRVRVKTMVMCYLRPSPFDRSP